MSHPLAPVRHRPCRSHLPAAVLLALLATGGSAQTTLEVAAALHSFSDGTGDAPRYLGGGLKVATRVVGPMDALVRIQSFRDKGDYPEPFDAVTIVEAGLQGRVGLGRRAQAAAGLGFGVATGKSMDQPRVTGTSVSAHGLLRWWFGSRVGLHIETQLRDLGGGIPDHAGTAFGLGLTLRF